MTLENIELESGKYILAVSGGVDSSVLLDVLSKQKNLSIVVAHFDHGIREDSSIDAEFVCRLAKGFGLEFELAEGNLEVEASESTARKARYDFLFSVCKKYNARLITAHHQDDMLETVVLQLIRGSGPIGLTAMQRNPHVLRPMINIPKKDIALYARSCGVEWRDDPTNQDERYSRNYIRNKIMPRLEPAREDLLKLIDDNAYISQQIEEELREIFESNGQSLNRGVYVSLDFDSATYLTRAVLKLCGLAYDSRQFIEHVTIAVKTLPWGKKVSLGSNVFLVSRKNGCDIVDKNGGSLLYNLDVYGEKETSHS